MRMEIDLDYIKQIIEFAKESGLKEIEIAEGQRSFRFVLTKDEVVPVTRPSIPQPIEVVEKVSEETNQQLSTHQIKSPMVGTFYASPAPGEQPFVNTGQRVQEGDIICLIEAMKMFNKVRADRSGVLKRVLIEDGGVVEYDQTLFEFEEA